VVVGLAVLALAAGAAACGDSDDAADESSDPTIVPRDERPPTKFSELEEIFNPMVEPMGLELTRGALIDRTDGGYEVSDEGRHLALYVEPIDDDEWDVDRYVTNFYDLTALLTPYVFERWSEIETYDICQEPAAADDDRPEPFPETQIDITRAASESFDWENSDLVDLLELDLVEDDVRTVVGEKVRVARAYTEAYSDAQARAGAAANGPGRTTSPSTGN
jgi:hypothetical protein